MKKLFLVLTLFFPLFLFGCSFDSNNEVKEIKKVSIEKVDENYIIIDLSNSFMEKPILYKLETENTSIYENINSIYVEVTYKNIKKTKIVSVVILE